MTKAGKPRVCIDFDGVIYSYRSGWKGARKLPDVPVEDALEFIAELQRSGFTVAILSSRSRHRGARYAMRKWMRKHLVIEIQRQVDSFPTWYMKEVGTRHALLDAFQEELGTIEPWDELLKSAARKIVRTIEWPRSKPPAVLYIDDRAYRFTGSNWPSVDEIKSFQPWYKTAASGAAGTGE